MPRSSAFSILLAIAALVVRVAGAVALLAILTAAVLA